ncbi:porin family protein [Rheinheimera sp. YQF-2]|jgi:opacity protein-like surface antigen|uniref:Porin family protein n=1 Tax=Rheinheimera lutimaris TaxID=2740584 RepID=A0A7Y5EGT4_9GAMM|nr:porin family protein [Rheinheimera lutimaris]NRQ41730.1 porin family protein [Rheinheimera lutimaris]
MFKLIPTVVLAGSFVATAGYAQAQDSGFYLGGHYGQHKVELESDFADTDLKFGVAGVSAGYQLNQFLALEARYAEGIEDEDIIDGSDSAKFEIDRHMALMARGSIPLGERFSLFATAGYGETRYALTYNIPGLTGSETSTEKGVIYGAGAAFNLTEQLSLVADYTILPELEDKDDGLFESDVSLMTVGLNYRF